jgi:hypothetical protein
MGGVGFQTIFRNGANEDNYITHGASGFTAFRNHNGSEFMRLTSAGLLGLGTSSPSTTFHLSATPQSTSDYFNHTIANFASNTSDGLSVVRTGTQQIGLKVNSSRNFVFGIEGASGAFTERMRIDTSGRVGIGTTAVDSEAKAAISNGGAEGLEFRAGNTSGVCEIITYNRSGAVHTDFRYDALSHQWKIGGVEKARLDSSGRLLVGTSSSPSAGGGQFSLSVVQGYAGGATGAGDFSLQRGQAATAMSSGDDIGYIKFNDNAGNTFASIAALADATPGAGDFPGRLVFSTTADGASSPTERMRITSGGQILAGGTSEAGNSNNVVQLGKYSGTAIAFGSVSTSGNSTSVEFFRGTTKVGEIFTTGTSSTTYSTSSDYRLKENVVPLQNAINRVTNLKPYRFNFISDPDIVLDGFLAHEAQTVVPEAIKGTKDEVDDEGNPVYQGIDQSKLVPLLTAALQEAIGRIETLEAEVAALKAS